MRRLQIIFALVLLTVAVGVAHGQGGFAIKAGYSFGVASNNGLAPGSTQRSGYAVGVGLSGRGPLALGIEGLFSERGFTTTTSVDSRHLNYIDVPVYLRLALSNPAITPFAYVGPQGSMEVQCKSDGDDPCPESGREKFTYAAVIGGGLTFGAISGLTVEGRYVYGLSDLNLSTVGTTSSYKTRSLLLLAGLSF